MRLSKSNLLFNYLIFYEKIIIFTLKKLIFLTKHLKKKFFCLFFNIQLNKWKGKIIYRITRILITNYYVFFTHEFKNRIVQ